MPNAGIIQDVGDFLAVQGKDREAEILRLHPGIILGDRDNNNSGPQSSKQEGGKQ